jgi:hypothetical protein
MNKFICIILLLFSKTFSFGEYNNLKFCKSSPTSFKIESSRILKSFQVTDNKVPDESPASPKKRRVRGISFEFLCVLSEKSYRLPVIAEKRLPVSSACISFYRHLSNGKRGPPSASFLL